MNSEENNVNTDDVTYCMVIACLQHYSLTQFEVTSELSMLRGPIWRQCWCSVHVPYAAPKPCPHPLHTND